MNSRTLVYKEVNGCTISADVFWEVPRDLPGHAPDQADPSRSVFDPVIGACLSKVIDFPLTHTA